MELGEQSGCCGAGIMAGQAFGNFLPLSDGVLVESGATEAVTKEGITLPEKSQGKKIRNLDLFLSVFNSRVFL